MKRKAFWGVFGLLAVLAAGAVMLSSCDLNRPSEKSVLGPTPGDESLDTALVAPSNSTVEGDESRRNVVSAEVSADAFPSSWKFPFYGSRQISAGYGPSGGSSFHTNQDYYAIDWNYPGSGDCGTPVLAAASGYVVFAGWQSGYGNTVIVDALNGYLYRVAHLERIAVGPMCVLRGATLGYCGTTPGPPYSSGCHIHFVVYRGSYAGGGRINGYSVPQTGMSGQWNLLIGGWYPSNQ